MIICYCFLCLIYCIRRQNTQNKELNRDDFSDKTVDEIEQMNSGGNSRASTVSPFTPDTDVSSQPRKYSDKHKRHFPSTGSDPISGNEETSPMRIQIGPQHEANPSDYNLNKFDSVQMTNINPMANMARPIQFNYLRSSTPVTQMSQNPSDVGDMISQIHSHHTHSGQGHSPIPSENDTELVLNNSGQTLQLSQHGNSNQHQMRPPPPPASTRKARVPKKRKSRSTASNIMSRQFSKTATSDRVSTSSSDSSESEEDDSSEYTTATQTTATAMTGYTAASTQDRPQMDAGDSSYRNNYKKASKLKKGRSKSPNLGPKFVPQTHTSPPQMLGQVVDLGSSNSANSPSPDPDSPPTKPVLTDNASWNKKYNQLRAMQQQLYGNQAIPPGPGQMAAMMRMQQNNTVNIQFNGNVILPQIAVGNQHQNQLQKFPYNRGGQQQQYKMPQNIMKQNQNQLSVSPPVSPPIEHHANIHRPMSFGKGGRKHVKSTTTEVSQLSDLTRVSTTQNYLGVDNSPIDQLTEITEMTTTNDDDTDDSSEYSDDDIVGDIQTPIGTPKKLDPTLKEISAASAFSNADSQIQIQIQHHTPYHNNKLNVNSITELDNNQIIKSFQD